MTTTTTVVTPEPRVQMAVRGSRPSERRFYIVAAFLMLILTAVGFRAFFLQGKAFGGGEITRQIVPLVIAHGLAMSAWVILFCVQSVLIVTGNRRVHTKIGLAGGVLAAANVLLGAAVAVASVHYNPELYKTFGGPEFFLTVMLAEVLAFATLVGIALRYRRRAEIHRPMMLLATVVIISGSLGRFPYIAHIAALPPLYVWGPTLLFGALLFVLQWALSGVANRWYAVGYTGIVVASLLSVGLGYTPVWSNIVRSFVW